MLRIVNLYRCSVGKKIVMAVTGAIFLLFVIGHLLGNLKIYQGADKFNAYAEFLREVGSPALPHTGVLWIARVVLLAAVAAHMISAAQLTLASWKARGRPYQKQEHIAFSYASYTMRWGGVVVALYVLYHLLHLTWGKVHPNFMPNSAYHNVVAGFQVWWVSLTYIVVMAPLGLHIYHGIWSAMQTLGINNPSYNTWRRPAAAFVALAIAAGYISIPVSVLTGFVN
jgi:succinate dehydrogenase / fumarate reductase cytochrome b subunit